MIWEGKLRHVMRDLLPRWFCARWLLVFMFPRLPLFFFLLLKNEWEVYSFPEVGLACVLMVIIGLVAWIEAPWQKLTTLIALPFLELNNMQSSGPRTLLEISGKNNNKCYIYKKEWNVGPGCLVDDKFGFRNVILLYTMRLRITRVKAKSFDDIIKLKNNIFYLTGEIIQMQYKFDLSLAHCRLIKWRCRPRLLME